MVPFSELAASINAFVSTTIAPDLRARSSIAFQMTQMWVNVSPPGGRNAMHHHGLSYFSGAYFLDVPEGAAPLVLHDPRTMVPILMRTSGVVSEITPLTADEIPIEAKPGDLHVFPGWLQHEVPPGTNQQPRVSVAFNYSVVNAPTTT